MKNIQSFTTLKIVVLLVVFSFLKAAAQTGDSCHTAISVQNWFNVPDSDIVVHQADNWYVFHNDSLSININLQKSPNAPNNGKFKHVKIYTGSCTSLSLVFDTTISHGANQLTINLTGMSPGNYYLRIINMDTISCPPCANPYNLKMAIDNHYRLLITWPPPTSTPCPNIIINPGFESGLANWAQVNSPDIFTNGVSIPSGILFGGATVANPPFPSITTPNNSYAGCATAIYQNGAWNTGYPETMTQGFTTLTNAKRYVVKAKIALAPLRYSSNHMDVTVGNTIQIAAPMLLNSNVWNNLENSFISNGTENSITIGNTSIQPNNMNTSIVTVDPNSNIWMAYYFADDIELFRLADAGPDQTITACLPAHIGTCNIPNATYTWSPAAGLSNANIAQPFAMPAATTTYIVNVSYVVNGNIVTDADTMVVTVPPCNCLADAGPDITITDCVPLTIGPDCVNPDLTYSWSPVTGLSDPNIPNPTAMPGTTTMYILTVSHAGTGGYTYEDTDTVIVTNNEMVCINNITPHYVSTSMNAGATWGSSLPGPIVAIDGIVNVTSNFAISNTEVVLGPHAKINVYGGGVLKINNSYLHGCCQLWQGILVGGNGTLQITGSTIEDADTAVTAIFNAVYKLDHTTFNKNYLDVDAWGSGFNQTAIVTNCTFDCDNGIAPATFPYSGLRAPLFGYRSFTGVRATDLFPTNTLTIGGSAITGNTFKNHDYGIAGSAVGLTASHNYFTGIDGNSINTYQIGPFAKGTAIAVENTGSTNYYTSLTNNTIENGTTGIRIFNGYSAAILNNTITQMKQFGIVYHDNKHKSFRIFDNHIDNVGWVGIYGLNNPLTSQEIHRNVIKNTDDVFLRTGIAVDELSFANIPYLIKIHSDTLDNLQYGISVTQGTGPDIANNWINIQHTSWGEYSFGIKPINCFRSQIIGNYIFGTDRDEFFVDAIRNVFGDAPHILCNYMVKTGSGIFFQGSSIAAAIVRRNIFLKDFWGIVLEADAAIGPQIEPGGYSLSNQWIGSMANPDYSHTFTYNADGNLSRFYTLSGYPWEPFVATSNVGMPAPWTIVSNNDTIDCLHYRDSLTTANYIIAPEDSLNEREIMNQINKSDSTGVSIEAGWWAKTSAYTQLKMNDSIVPQNYRLVVFKDSVANAVWGKMFEMDKAMVHDSIDILTDSLIDVNNSIVPQQQMEEINKTVTAIKLQREKNNEKTLTDSDIEGLRIIAELCPLEYGPGVFTARALLRGQDNRRTEYMNECEKVYPTSNSSRRANENNNSNYANSLTYNEVSISPNPAQTALIINYTPTFNSYSIEEASGRIIENGNLIAEKVSQLIDVSSYANGIYIMTLKGNNTFKKLKFVVTK